MPTRPLPGPTPRNVPQRSGVGVFEWNPRTLEIWWDDVLTELFGPRDGEELIATWLRRIHPDDQERVLTAFGDFNEVEDVYRLVMDDGSIRHLLSRTTYVVRDEHGDPIKVAGVTLDVTTVNQVGTRLESMLEAISDGFVALDSDFRFTYVNASAERILGRSRDLLLGDVLFDAFPHARGTQFETVYRRVMQHGRAESFEAFYPEPLSVWVQVTAQPADVGIVLYFQDVTARRAEQDERERMLEAERAARADAEVARRQAEAARAETERANARLAHAASHDSLTRLLNRRELERRLQAQLDFGDPLVLLFLDLDRFKLVNDSLGHAAGDELLATVADRLTLLMRSDDVIARIGGDEFVVLLRSSTSSAKSVAERMLATVREPVQVSQGLVQTSASIGLAAAGPGATVQTLLRDADFALYRAKEAGRGRLAWFDADSHRQLLDRIALETDLRAALEARSIGLHYQPSFRLDTMTVTGVEALARWQHPERGAVAPDQFIALAEECGLIQTLGAQLFQNACLQAARWADGRDFVVWVNVSGRQLEVPGLAEELLASASAASVPAHRLGVEVTESTLMDERAAAHELARLAEAGLSVAIDDFGTGYSSLARLTALPIDVLKIDRSFVGELHTVPGRAAVMAVIQLARALGLSTHAEGVETPEQLRELREMGCDVASGYLLARPAPADQLRLRPPGVPAPRQDGEGPVPQTAPAHAGGDQSTGGTSA